MVMCEDGLSSAGLRLGTCSYGDLPNVDPAKRRERQSRSQTYSNRSMTSPTQHTNNNPWNIAAMEEGGSPWDGK
jgi:hypothetical protein